jgi:hypothetical protein
VAFVLLILGAFSLFLCLAVLMRSGMASGSGEPIPDEPDAQPEVRFARWIARSERRSVPALRTLGRLFLILGLLMILASGVAWLAALA